MKLETKKTLVKIDDLDLKILTILMEDSRTSLNKMAEKLGVSVSTVSARVKKLENLGVIGKYTIYVDCKKLGFENIVFILIKTTGDNSSVIKKLWEIPNVKAIYQTAGFYDILIQGIALDNETLDELLTKVKTIDGVIEVGTLLVLRTEKESMYPDPTCLMRAIEHALKTT